MTSIDKDDLKVLTANGDDVSVSLYAPMISAGPETVQNRIRWKSLLARAEDALREQDLGGAEIDALLGHARELLDDRVFWEYQEKGLAYFASPGWSRYFRLQVEVPYLAAVGQRFLVAPLLDVVAARRFLLLTLTRDEARLFEGTRFGLEEVVGALPTRPESEPPVRERPGAYRAGRGGAGTGVVFYTRGDLDQRRREETLRYFRAIDAAVNKFADRTGVPLVLVADEDLLPLYREVSTYPGIVVRGMNVHPAQLPLDLLHAQAWKKLESLLRRDEDVAVARYNQLRGTGLTVVGSPAVLAAAVAGRVEALLLTQPVVTRASSGPTVLRLDAGTPTVLDQVDRAAAATLAHGGEVHIVPLERLPHQGPAAVLRY